MTNYLNSVESLLKRAERFESMTSGQQAAFRANLTMLRKRVDDPEIAQILDDLQAEIGLPEKRERAMMTPDDLRNEYRDKFGGYNDRQKAAFKAKVTRLAKRLTEEGDVETAKGLETILTDIAEVEAQALRKRILNLAKKRSKK